MAVKQKNREAAEFHLRAEARMKELRDTISNLDTPMSTDELKAAETELNDLQKRAAIVGGFTPDEEIEDQGGSELAQRAAPENDAPDLKDSHKERVTTLQRAILKEFGGVQRFIRLAANHKSDLTPGQAKVVAEVRKFTRTIVGTASDASGGEFVLPLQQEKSIFAVPNVVTGILEKARRFPVTGRTLRIPFAKQSTASNTRPMAGFAAVGIIAENGTLQTREPAFDQRLLTVYKIGAIAQIADETLDDDMTGQMESTVSTMVGGEIMNHFNALVTIDGTGSSQPTGALHTSANAALIKVPRKTANLIQTQDVFRMYMQHTMGPDSFWLVGRGCLEQVLTLSLGSTSLVTFLPNLVGVPPMTLLGLPLIISDLPAALGSESDIALVNPAFYAVAIRQMLSFAKSEHVAFTTDVMTYRWIARAGGIPIPDGTYAYKAPGGTKTNAHSPFVALDDAVAS